MEEENNLRIDQMSADELKKLYRYSLILRGIGNVFLLVALVCIGLFIYFCKNYFCMNYHWANLKLIISFAFMAICAIAIMYTYRYCRSKIALKFFLFNSIFCFSYFSPVFSFLLTDDDIPIITQIGYTTTGILLLISLIIFFYIVIAGIISVIGINSLILKDFSHNQIIIAKNNAKKKEFFKDEDLTIEKQNRILNKICLILSFMFYVFLYIAKLCYLGLLGVIHG